MSDFQLLQALEYGRGAAAEQADTDDDFRALLASLEIAIGKLTGAHGDVTYTATRDRMIRTKHDTDDEAADVIGAINALYDDSTPARARTATTYVDALNRELG